jgi:hypothetical protein
VARALAELEQVLNGPLAHSLLPSSRNGSHARDKESPALERALPHQPEAQARTAQGLPR